MMCFNSIVITTNLAARLAANSWMGGKLEQTINQYIVTFYLKAMLITHVSAVDVSH